MATVWIDKGRGQDTIHRDPKGVRMARKASRKTPSALRLGTEIQKSTLSSAHSTDDSDFSGMVRVQERRHSTVVFADTLATILLNESDMQFRPTIPLEDEVYRVSTADAVEVGGPAGETVAKKGHERKDWAVEIPCIQILSTAPTTSNAGWHGEESGSLHLITQFLNMGSIFQQIRGNVKSLTLCFSFNLDWI